MSISNNFNYDVHTQWQSSLNREEKELVRLLKTVEKELSHAPPGSLLITQKDSRTWFYQRYTRPGSRPVYLNKENEALRAALAQKSYDLELKKALEEELRSVQKGKLLTFRDLGAVYDSFPLVWQQYIEPHVLPDKLFAEHWLEEYRQTATGDDFKSKSEYITSGIYDRNRWYHVYEPRLYLEGYGTVRPDFVALNLRTRQTFYHEHFGMMDDPDYCRKALAKLESYHRNGFFEGKNLIITMESSMRPMVPEEVEAILRFHLN